MRNRGRLREFDYGVPFPELSMPDKVEFVIYYHPIPFANLVSIIDEEILGELNLFRTYLGGVPIGCVRTAYSYIFNNIGLGNKANSRTREISCEGYSFPLRDLEINTALGLYLNNHEHTLPAPLSAIKIETKIENVFFLISVHVSVNIMRTFNHHQNVVMDWGDSQAGCVPTFFRDADRSTDSMRDNVFTYLPPSVEIRRAIFNTILSNITMIHLDIRKALDYIPEGQFRELSIERITLKSFEVAWHFCHDNALAVAEQLIPQFVSYGKQHGEDRQRNAQSSGSEHGTRNAIVRMSSNVTHKLYAKNRRLLRFEAVLKGDALRTSTELFEVNPETRRNGTYSQRKTIRGNTDLRRMAEDMTNMIQALSMKARTLMLPVYNSLNRPYPAPDDITTWWLANKKGNDSLDDWICILEHLLRPGGVIPELLPESAKNALRRAEYRNLLFKRRGRYHITFLHEGM